MKNMLLTCALLTVWLSLIAAGCNPQMGKLNGTVQYRGLPCQPGQPDHNVPPCSGNYPSYEVEIYLAAQLDKPVLTVKTGEDGSYSADLPEGEYVIRTQNGPQEKHKADNKFKITAGQTTVLPLTVSTGIL